MVYIDGKGRRLEKKPYGLNSISELFWSMLNFLYVFFITMFSVDARDKLMNGRSSRPNPGNDGGGKPGGPGGPKRRMGGFGPGTSGEETQNIPMSGG